MVLRLAIKNVGIFFANA